jgi:hypothetical protein
VFERSRFVFALLIFLQFLGQAARAAEPLPCDKFQGLLLQKIEDQGNLVALPEFSKRFQSEDGFRVSYDLNKIVGVESVLSCYGKMVASLHINFEAEYDASDRSSIALHYRAFALGKAALCVLDDRKCDKILDTADNEALLALAKSINRGDPEPSESIDYRIANGKILDSDQQRTDEYIKIVIGIEVVRQPSSTNISIYTPSNWGFSK